MYPHAKTTIVDEICDNAIDDDGDGLIDLNDSDCVCITITPESLIPNSSFEETNCCPEEQAELNCATGWIQASTPTTDFINTCGWMSWDNDIDQFPPPQPFPDGQGIVGFRNGVFFPANDDTGSEGLIEHNWKEYAGACLLSPMLADSLYRIEFDLGFVNSISSPPIVVTLFGTTECINLPFIEEEGEPLTGCPSNDENWVELGAIPVIGGDNIWVKAAIEFQYPEDIKAIAIGPDCANNLNGHNRYYFLDNLLLDEVESFQINITTTSHPCAADFALEVENHADQTYQWYKEGIALLGETNATLSQMYGEGNYQVRTIREEECMLSGIYPFTIPVITSTVYQSICAGEVFQFGDQELSDSGFYSDTLSTANVCDSVVLLELEIENALVDTINTMIFEGETFSIEDYSFDQPGEYFITLTSPNGCKVETSVQLDFYDVFIPNVFSPNFDGINDYFTILAENGLIREVEISIFDRWGGLVYQGPEWDGQRNNEGVDPGVYIYIIQVTLNDNKSHLFSGSVTVLL